MVGIIYKAENKINNNCYIGKTVQELKKRKYRHKTNAYRYEYISAFHSAIRKYGWNNFEWSILVETDSERKLSSLENIIQKKRKEKYPNLKGKNNGIRNSSWLRNKTE